MARRKIIRRIGAMEVSEGAGVLVRRSIGLPGLRHLDPFLLLDHFGSDNPEDYGAGFPDHPHRGFITLTYMLDGHMLHRDSMGNRGDLRSGGAQWMKAASGVIHSEMPQQTNGLMRGFQLWINLPASEKLSDPAYQEFPAAAIPEFRLDNLKVKVLCGTYGKVQGPIEDPHTQVQYLDVEIPPGGHFTHHLPWEHRAFVYPFSGQLEIESQQVRSHELGVLGEGEELWLGSTGGARFLLVAGRPLGEPIVQAGPFVMNSREEIEQAYADYKGGRLVRSRAKFHAPYA